MKVELKNGIVIEVENPEEVDKLIKSLIWRNVARGKAKEEFEEGKEYRCQVCRKRLTGSQRKICDNPRCQKIYRNRRDRTRRKRERAKAFREETRIPVRILEGRKRVKKDGKRCEFCGEPLPKYKASICNNPVCQKKASVRRLHKYLVRKEENLVGLPI